MKIQYHKSNFFPFLLLKIPRFNYQLLWEQQDQIECITFPQVLTEIELLPYTISNRNKHFHYRDLTSFNTNYSETIKYDNKLIVEHSETSDSGPYTTLNIISETSFEEQNQNFLQFNQNDNTELFQNPEPQQLITAPDQQQNIPTIQNLRDLSDTATIQNVSELSDVTINIPQSFTITSDSNVTTRSRS